jgi:nitrogen fixation/metabolism regulation signal transduction histidine kinase
MDQPEIRLSQDYLVVAHRLSETLGRDAERLTSATAEYRQLTLQRSEIKTLFALTLTLVLLITLFSAIAIALMLSQTITEPLTALAEATRAVAKGDYSRLNPVTGRDEFGVLTQSFNTMTRRIAEATETMQQNQLQIENARANLATILARLQSGVLTLDGELRLQSANTAASLILAEPMDTRIGQPPTQWATSSAALALLDIIQRKDDSDSRPKNRVKDAESITWERQVRLVINSMERALIVRCSQLTLRAAHASVDEQMQESTQQTTYILVFDDVTQIVEGERQAAWSEVARRLAHEIKNPLTPIQLSAQRIASKLQPKLQPEDAQMLARGTDTIVNQVTILKSMVDDFSMYAKASRIQMATVNINQLIDDVLNLYEAMPVHISRRNSVDLPPIEADAGMLRQVIHNLVQNACDALLQGQGDSTVRVTSDENERRRAAQMTATATSLTALRGSIVISTSIEQQESTRYVKIEITDDGPGLDPQVAARVFEPYVTTKPKGTGLGLAIVKRIIEEHHGMISLENIHSAGASGARATILLPTAQPSQKLDASSKRANLA